MDQVFQEAISVGKQKREEIQNAKDTELRKKAQEYCDNKEQSEMNSEKYQESIKKYENSVPKTARQSKIPEV